MSKLDHGTFSVNSRSRFSSIFNACITSRSSWRKKNLKATFRFSHRSFASAKQNHKDLPFFLKFSYCPTSDNLSTRPPTVIGSQGKAVESHTLFPGVIPEIVNVVINLFFRPADCRVWHSQTVWFYWYLEQESALGNSTYSNSSRKPKIVGHGNLSKFSAPFRCRK